MPDLPVHFRRPIVLDEMFDPLQNDLLFDKIVAEPE
jgi:hypothetical protein